MRRSELFNRLQALEDGLLKNMSDAFFQSIRNITDDIRLQQVIDAIEAGNIDRAIQVMHIDERVFRPMETTLATTFNQTAAIVAANVNRGVRGVGSVFRFDYRNSAAETFLKNQSSKLVTGITNDTRENVRSILQNGLAQGQNPRKVALDIVGRVDPVTGRRTGGTIGLSKPQSDHVSNARKELSSGNLSDYLKRERRDKRFDKTVEKAIKNNKPLPPEVVDKIVDRYSDSLLKLRGDTVGRTEVVQALNESQFQVFNQATKEGKIVEPDKVWDSSGDNRVRATHVKLDGQKVKLSETFVSEATGARLRFPGDASLGAPGSELINCRCRVDYQVDFFANLSRVEDTPA